MVYSSKDKSRFIVNCNCGCGDGVEIKINKDEDGYANIGITGSYWYMNQKTAWHNFLKKLKKIWHIICNKDYYYADIIMSESEWDDFVEMVQGVDKKFCVKLDMEKLERALKKND